MVFFRGELPDLASASAAPARDQVAAIKALRSETRRILMGFDVNPERAERLVEILSSSPEGISDSLRSDLAQLALDVELIADIEALFNTSNLGQTQELLDKYNISYVYVGPLERERYSPQGLNKFARLMDVAFQQDDVTIYQRK